MTRDEILKLALEALEASHLLIHGSETKGGVRDYIDGYYSGCFDFVSNKNQINEAITAIKEALAQRTWVGLTDEEVDKIYEAHHNQYGECESVNFGYERAIEAKLKEKNTCTHS